MKHYTYNGLIAVVTGLSRVAGTGFVVLGISVAILGIGVFMGDASASGSLYFGLLWGLGAIIGGLFFAYTYPNVAVDKEGVSLRAWPYPVIRIPWGAVRGVHEGTFLKRNVIFVQVHGNLPLHLLYGVYFIRRLKPGFLVRREIDGFIDLWRSLNRRSV
jgi:hypothetical protein